MIKKNRMIKVSITQEGLLARKLGVEYVEFSEIVYVNQYTVNFVYTVKDRRNDLGTISLAWSTRRPDHWITLKRFSDNIIMNVKMLDDIRAYKFFKEEA